MLLMVREWNCGGWLTPEEQCITILEPREYLPLGKAVNEHNAVIRVQRRYREVLEAIAEHGIGWEGDEASKVLAEPTKEKSS